MQNYQEPESPLFTGDYAPAGRSFEGTLTVVTWNIRFGEEIEAAIEELSTTAALSDADILLLQEMHAEGVDAIALALGYNYVYYPASIHTHHGKDFGNAVLSKWPLVDSGKIRLPNESWRNGQRRIAVKGVLAIDGRLIDAYSVHTETVWMGANARAEQMDTISAEVGAESGPAVVGGDFNTVAPQSVLSLDDRFAAAGFVRASPLAEPTYKAGFGLTLDHLYVRGFTVEASGVVAQTTASDHSPVWAVIGVDP